MPRRSVRSEALAAENAELRASIAALTGTIETLSKTISRLESAFAEQKITLEKTLGELQALRQKLFRKKSEKLPPPNKELAKRERRSISKEETQKKRRARADARNAVEVDCASVPVADDRRTCPHCGRAHLRSVGGGRVVSILDYIPGRFIRREFVLETLSCACGDYITTAESPVRPFEQGKYGPHFIAYVIVSKLLDAIPHHRLEKMFGRNGIPMSRSTMTDLLHRAPEMLAPLVARLFLRIAAGEVVQADETSIRVQHREKLGFVWTFIHGKLIGYRFSPDRSGDTPREFLGETRGVLVVDGYTGYNGVTTPAGRVRAGCWAHVRRKLFEARVQAPEANAGLELILDLCEVERRAKELGIAGTADHLDLRRHDSAPVIEKLRQWFEAQTKLHPSRSQIGVALRYALKNWGPLTVFLENARVPLDNNRSESALRAVAIGRKNFLFVGNDTAGQNIAGLLSLIATCVACEINPLAYLADVLIRVHTHSVDELDDLLPVRWLTLVEKS